MKMYDVLVVVALRKFTDAKEPNGIPPAKVRLGVLIILVGMQKTTDEPKSPLSSI